MKAMLTLSLGGTYPEPPKTCRGTMEKPAATVALWAKNSRRESRCDDRDRLVGFTVPPDAPDPGCMRILGPCGANNSDTLNQRIVGNNDGNHFCRRLPDFHRAR